jgi:mannosyl-oligosaccharide glucosidase
MPPVHTRAVCSPPDTQPPHAKVTPQAAARPSQLARSHRTSLHTQVSLFPLLLRLLPADAPQLPHVLELLRDPARLWSPYGLRSLSRDDLWYGKQNAPGDEPYWRGPIWINLNYLALSGLRHYATVAGPSQQRASDIYTELRDNLVGNMLDEWKRTGYFWEQYDPDTGAGKRTHPFNGWSSLALLALAEVY